MFLVAGESLVDLIGQADTRAQQGTFRAHLGGSPYNVARGLGLMGVPVAYLNPLSKDAFGQALRAGLEAEGVTLCWPEPVPEPSSLALVSLDARGQASYQFYREGVADRIGTAEQLVARLPEGLTWIQAGAFLFVNPEDALKWLKVLRAAKARGARIALDPNVRPALVAHREAYKQAIHQAFEMADLIKLSDEDLAFLYPGKDPLTQVRHLRETSQAALWVLTMGAEGAVLLSAAAEARVPATLPGALVDTVGAGDTFQAALLSQASTYGTLETATLVRLGRYAAMAAGINCTRAGCQPPTAQEIEAALDLPPTEA